MLEWGLPIWKACDLDHIIIVWPCPPCRGEIVPIMRGVLCQDGDLVCNRHKSVRLHCFFALYLPNAGLFSFDLSRDCHENQIAEMDSLQLRSARNLLSRLFRGTITPLYRHEKPARGNVLIAYIN